MTRQPINPRVALVSIKLMHSVVWAFFVLCIIGIPLAAHRGRYGLSLILVSMVLLEVLVLVVNRWRCPLTGVAARYTDERSPNFDIYLPRWVARYNKQLFGSLFVAGTVYAAVRWGESLLV